MLGMHTKLLLRIWQRVVVILIKQPINYNHKSKKEKSLISSKKLKNWKQITTLEKDLGQDLKKKMLLKEQ